MRYEDRVMTEHTNVGEKESWGCTWSKYTIHMNETVLTIYPLTCSEGKLI